MIYKYDLELKPLLDLPDISKAVKAIDELMAKVLEKRVEPPKVARSEHIKT